MLAFRCTEDDYKFVNDIAKEKNIASTEVVSVLLRAAIEEYKNPKVIPFVPENCAKDCSHIEKYL